MSNNNLYLVFSITFGNTLLFNIKEYGPYKYVKNINYKQYFVK